MSQDIFPEDLKTIIETHRALFGGFRMEAEGEAPPAPAAPQAEEASAPAAPPQAEETPAEDVSGLPEWARKRIEKLTKEAGDSRIKAKADAAEEARQQMAQSIGKALGLVKDDEKVDPEKLASDLQASQKAKADAETQLAVFKLATKAGADPETLLDSRSFLTSLEKIDVADEKKLTAAILEAVKAQPKFAARAVGKSGSDTVGHGETPTNKETPASLHDAVEADYRVTQRG